MIKAFIIKESFSCKYIFDMLDAKIVESLKTVSKFILSKDDVPKVVSLLKINPLVLDKILAKNKIQSIFLKHIESIKCVDELDKQIYQKYCNHLFRLQFEYQEYLETLSSLIAKLNSHNIKYAFLKGFANNSELFVERGILYRTFSDADILINPLQIKDVEKILNNQGFIQGYIENNKIIPASRKDIVYWQLNSHQLHEFTKKSKFSNISSSFRINIDINTTIFEGGKYADPIPSQNILQHTMMRKINNELSIVCLDYTYNLIQLCYHFFKDTIYKSKIENQENYCLRKFMDIREYVLKYKSLIDWNEFINSTKKSGISYKIYYPLKLVSLFYKDLGIDNILGALLDKNSDDILESDLDWSSMLL